MTTDYSNSLWTPGFYTFHVYFLYHLTWCRAFIRKSCRTICPLVAIPEHARSFYNFYHLQDKIIQMSRFCQIWQKWVNRQKIYTLSNLATYILQPNFHQSFLHQIYYFTQSSGRQLYSVKCQIIMFYYMSNDRQFYLLSGESGTLME